MIYRFGDRSLDDKTLEIQGPDGPISVEPRVFETLLYLVQHADRVISRQELLEQVWHSEHVTDSAVARCIMEARRAVGDNGSNGSLIKTIHGRGYRFVAPLEAIGDRAESAAAEDRNRSILYSGIAAGALLVLAGGLVWRVLAPGREHPPTSDPSPIRVELEVAGTDADLQWLGLALQDLIRLQMAEEPSLFGVESPSETKLSLQVEPSPILGHARIHTSLEYLLPAGNVETSPLSTLVVPQVQPGEAPELFESIRRAVAETTLPRLVTTLDREVSGTPEEKEAWQLYLRAVAETGPVCDGGATAELLTRSIELEPDFGPAWTWLGGVRLMQAKFCAGQTARLAEVEKAVERAAAIDPDSPVPLALETTLLTYRGDPQKANEVLTASAERFPESLGIRLGRSTVLRYLGDLEGSLQEFEETLEAWPALPFAGGFVPYPYRYRNEWERFLDLLTGWDSPHFRFYHGLAELRLGNEAAAIAALEPAFRDHPGDLYGRLSQALLGVIEGNEAEARVVLDQLADQRLAPIGLDGEVDFEIAELYAMAGDGESAVAQLELALNRGFLCAPCMESSVAFEPLLIEGALDELLGKARAAAP